MPNTAIKTYEELMARLTKGNKSLTQHPVASAPASPAAPAIPPVPQTPPRREERRDADITGDLGGRGYDYGGRQQAQEMPGNWLLIALLLSFIGLIAVGWNIFYGGVKPTPVAPSELVAVEKTVPTPSPIVARDPVVSAVATISEPLGLSELVGSTDHWGTDIAQAIRVDSMGSVFAIKVNGSFEVCSNSETFGNEMVATGNFGSRLAEVSKDCASWLKEKPDAIYQVRVVGNHRIRIFFEKRR